LGKGEWALTAVGLTEAQALRAEFESQEVEAAAPETKGPNATAKWLEQHYRPLYARLHSYLERKMPKSKELEKVDDHIQTFFTSLIRRDGLRTRIEEGAPIRYSQICAWARRSAITEIRDEGTEPVCRLHGALTKKEQGMYDPSNWTEQVIPNTINTSEILGHHSGLSEDATPTEFLVGSDNVEAEVLDEDAFHEALKAVGAALEAEISHEKDPDLHMELMKDRFILGMTVKEIAEKYGMDRNKATVALGRIRKAVARHRDELEDEFLR
jgi:DNA-directed RNA polymerase specialized sigma24 family protein